MSIIKVIKLNSNNIYRIGNLPAEVGSSSSDATVGAGGGGRERERRDREIEIPYFSTVTTSSWLVILCIY